MADQEPAQIIKIFSEEPVFQITGRLAQFSGRPPQGLYLNEGRPDPDYDALFRFYNSKPSGFRERVAVIRTIDDVLTNPSAIPVDWVSSADVQAKNAERIPTDSFLQIAADGVTLTRDNYLLVGSRGGAVTPERVVQFGSGLWGCFPGGSVTYPSDSTGPCCLIKETLEAEFGEELGNFGREHVRTAGVHKSSRPGPTGYKFVGVLKTDATLAQIQDNHRKALGRFNELVAGGMPKADAQKILHQEGLPQDAWESDFYWGLPNKPEVIKNFLNQHSRVMIGNMYGDLSVYLATQNLD